MIDSGQDKAEKGKRIAKLKCSKGKRQLAGKTHKTQQKGQRERKRGDKGLARRAQISVTTSRGEEKYKEIQRSRKEKYGITPVGAR